MHQNVSGKRYIAGEMMCADGAVLMIHNKDDDEVVVEWTVLQPRWDHTVNSSYPLGLGSC